MPKNVFQGDVGNVADTITNATANIVKPSLPDGLDLAKLASQLGRLRQAMKQDAASGNSDEHDEAIGQIASAEKAAKNGDGSKMAEVLKGVGGWALGVAEKIGVELAVSTIKSTMGLPPK